MRGPIELLRASLADIKQRAGLLSGILLVLGAFSLLSSYMEPFRTSGMLSTVEGIAFIIAIILYMAVSILASVALILAFAGQTDSVKGAYKQSMSFFWRYLGLSIVMSVIIVIGYLLLIIPGIIFSVWFVFSGFILILEGAGIKESLSRSREYVQGKWWGVFGRAVVLMLLAGLFFPIFAMFALIMPDNAMVMNLWSTIGSLIITVVGIGYFYNLYQDVKGGAGIGQTSPMNNANTSAAPNYGGGNAV